MPLLYRLDERLTALKETQDGLLAKAAGDLKSSLGAYFTAENEYFKELNASVGQLLNGLRKLQDQMGPPL